MTVVTGGAGFIGSNMVRALNLRGDSDILIVDHLNEAKKRNLIGLQYARYLDKGEFLPLLAGKANGITAILHQGACSDTTETDLDYLDHNNLQYSKAVLKACQRWGVPLIYASSASVYGNGSNGFAENPRCEEALNGYALSKLNFDLHVRSEMALGRLSSPVVGLRYFNVYGPQENHKGAMASVPFHFFRQGSKDQALRLFEGSDGFKRDFVHVDDVVAVVLHFLDHSAMGIFNCGTGIARSFVELAHAFQRLIAGTELVTIPFPDHLKGKYQAYTCADLSALRGVGCHHQFINLAGGIEQYYAVLASTDGYFVAP